MNKVKIFESTRIDILEAQVNGFLESLSPLDALVDIKLTSYDVSLKWQEQNFSEGSEGVVSAMVIYKTRNE